MRVSFRPDRGVPDAGDMYPYGNGPPGQWEILPGALPLSVCPVPLFFQYFYVLIQEIVKANLCVLKIIISPEIQPEPALVYFGTDLQSELSKVILANSITLTPGTITVSLEDNRFCVHCLDRELAEGMENSVFVELLKKMEAEERKWR